MALIEDVNNKKGQHTVKNDYWQQIGERVVRCHLPVGDYCRPAPTIVDTKRDISELAANVDSDHERFRNAAILARDIGSQLVILVENTDGVTDLSNLCGWVNPRNEYNKRHGLKPPIDGTRLAKACATMEKRYGLRFEFCEPEEAGQRVVEILTEEGGRDG